MDAQQIIDELRDRLVRFRGRYVDMAADDPDLDYSWLSKFANGRLQNPTIRRLEALDRVLCRYESSDRAA
jgi:hypothetical protein